MSLKNRKLYARSGKRNCDLCDAISFLVAHHIRGRKITNYNHFSNIAYICPNCHDRTHLGEIIIEDWVMTSSGKELLWHYKDEIGITGREAKPHIY